MLNLLIENLFIMENNLEKNEEINNGNLVLSQTAIESLQKTSPWAKFISVIGLIFGGFLIVAAFYFLLSKDLLRNNGSSMCITYLIFAFICIRVNLLLYNYSVELKNINNENSLEYAFMMQHKFWKYNGIVVIVYLSFVLLFLFSFIITDLIS